MSTSPPRTVGIFVVAIALIVVVHMGWLFFLRPFTFALSALAQPLYALGIDVERISTALAEKPGDPEELKKIIEILQIQNAKLQSVAAENEALKTALNFKEKRTDTTILARAISQSGDDMSRALIIDRGTDDGIRIGQPVIAGDGILIGKISESKPTRSVVLLLFDSKSKLAVTIQTNKETLGILEGDRGLSMQITLIPQTQALSPGTTIITSGLEPGIRRGLIVGTVNTVTQDTQQQFQTASITPLRDALYPLFVQVITTS